MKFEISTKPQLAWGTYFRPMPRKKISIFLVTDLVILDEVAIVLADLEVKYGMAWTEGVWSYTLQKLTTGGEERLSYDGVEFGVWYDCIAKPTYAFEIAFKKSDDAATFKLAYC